MTAMMRASLLMLALAWPAHAAPGAETPRAAGPEGVVLGYESVFDAYRPYVHQPVAPWRQSNDRVGEVGGWRAYAREAAQPEGAEGHAGHAPANTHDHGEGQ